MKILFDPEPRCTAEIFSDADRATFLAEYDVHEVDPAQRDRTYDLHLPETEVLISQQPMGTARLARAPKLRAIFNVETNFLPNIDYETCFARGIHVLTPASVFATPVAEIGLGVALSLARNIHGAHADFISGQERYGLEGNAGADLLTRSEIGFIGFGDLGRALHRLLAPFQATVRVFDPWLPDGLLRRHGVEPASLDEVLASSRCVFVVASVTSESTHLLNAGTLSRLQDAAMLILLSRAAVADFQALAAEAASGRLRIATDVFPEEPVALDDPIRTTPGILFSAHRAGALTSALRAIGALVLEDLSLIRRGLPPVTCRRAEKETAMSLRSKPIEMS